jgi:hypothetical protein
MKIFRRKKNELLEDQLSRPNSSSENLDSKIELRYFDLISTLLVENRVRYEQQARELIVIRTMKVAIHENVGLYKLDRVGCRFEISHDQEMTFTNSSWTRLGWRKKNKERYLPAFFAQTEASAIFEDN